MTGATSARTSRTRVDNVASAGSILDRDHDSILNGDEVNTGEHTNGVDPEVPQEPQVSVTFLLISGRRRTMLFQPEVTIGRVKELVWNGWPYEGQDERPPAPSYLRLLYYGKLLQDDETLTKLNLPTHIPSLPVSPDSASNPPPSTIIHLSIRPAAPACGDDLQKKKGRRRTRRSDGEVDGEDTPDSGCCSSCTIA